MAHPKHQQVRLRYGFRCGYCGVSETTTGGELTVDHYHPISAGGGDEDDNLVYACYRCNQYKHDFWPDVADIANNRRILQPLRDDMATHLRETEDFLLEGRTDTGRFHIVTLQLNRPPLVAHRQRERRVAAQETQISLLERIVDLQQQIISSRESE